MAGESQPWEAPNEYVHPVAREPGAAPCRKTQTVRDLLGPSFPRIVCLCGSTRFKADFAAANLRETLAGRIVLTVGCTIHSDEELRLGPDAKQRLDELHFRKIDLADEVLVLNVCGYIGPSTGNELAYALGSKKPVRTLEPMDLEKWRAERDRQMNTTAMKNLDR
ncbi:MAG TPA: hypothetical protein VMY35_07580 [Phycisphaerae bacterium]|nr:hypothetical protein [Phycisphaerae bacterium]